MMWRLLLTITMMLGGVLIAPETGAREAASAPVDLAAMLVPPSALPEPGYQFARGGYLTPDDVRYLVEQRYEVNDGTAAGVFEAAGWRQSYTGTMVLLSDRSYLLADPLARVTVTIHELADDDGAEVIGSYLTDATPAGSEARESAVEGAPTWRVVTSQEDALLSVARVGRYVVEVESADWQGRPSFDDHRALIVSTMRRVESEAGPGLSQRGVSVGDDRLVPVSVATEYPLAHTWYRAIDGEVVPAAGELEPPTVAQIAPGAKHVVVQRQSAELSSQNWVTAGVVLVQFASPADADAFDGVVRDPLDFFPTTETSSPVDARVVTGTVVAISGETRVGGRYSGYRITVVEGDTVAQLTIRAMGTTLVAQDGAERWAVAQQACLGSGACGIEPLVDLLQTPATGTPVADDGTYRSPVAAWSVAFDPSVWRVADTFAQDGYDYLNLRAGSMDATFETIVDHHGDPEQCVLDELDRLREDEAHARISVGSDDPAEAPGGLDETHGWIVYTIEPLSESRLGHDEVIRIDCYTVEPGTTSLVVQVRAPRDRWSELAPAAAALRSRIEIDGVPVGRSPGDLAGVTSMARSDQMINRRPWVGIAA